MQVDGCPFELPKTQYHKARPARYRFKFSSIFLIFQSLSFLLQRYKICSHHAGLNSMQLCGHAVRFCQQCGRFQPLSDFVGSMKSCRKKLDLHNAQRRRKRCLELGLPLSATRRSKKSYLTSPAATEVLTSLIFFEFLALLLNYQRRINIYFVFDNAEYSKLF